MNFSISMVATGLAVGDGAADPPRPRHDLSNAPPPFGCHVVTTRLMQDLCRRALADDCKLAAIETIVAPQGWGKTIAVARLYQQWARDGRRAGIWLGLKDHAPNGDGLLMHLARQSAAFVPCPDERPDAPAARLMGIRGTLAQVLQRVPKPFLICIDNIDYCTATLKPGLLDDLFALAPAGVHFVLTANHRLAFDRTGIRLQGNLREHDARDLAFVADEAQALLSGGGKTFDAEALRMLLGKTEGWVAGLRLCAILLDKTGTDPVLIEKLSDDIPDLRDWFDHHVLSAVPEELLEFLHYASLFPAFSAEQLTAVAGIADAWRHLRTLIGSGMFIHPLSALSAKYRFHSLFRDRLRADALRCIPAARLQECYRRMAGWALKESEWEEALDAALLSQDEALIVQTLDCVAPRIVRDLGKMQVFVESVEQLLSRKMPLGFEARYWYVYALTYHLRLVSADNQRRRLIRLLSEAGGGEDAYHRYRLEHLHIALAFLADDMQAAGKHATNWLTSDAEREPFDLGWMLSILSVHHLTAYRFAEARACLRQAAPIVREVGSPYLAGWCDLILATVSLYEGNLPRACKIIEDTLARTEASLGRDSDICDTICAIGSKCAFEMGDHDRAQEMLSRGLRSMDRHGTVGSSACAVETALAFWNGDESDPVFQRLSMTIGNYAPRLAVMFRCHIVRRLVQLGQIDRAEAWINEIDLDVRQGRLRTSPTEILPRFRDLLVMTSIEFLHASGEHSAALAMIGPELREARRGGRVLRAVRLELIQMSIFFSQGRLADASRQLGSALRQAQDRDMLQAFQRHRTVIGPLLQQIPLRMELYPRREGRAFITRVLAALDLNDGLAAPFLAEENAPSEALTTREQELMELVGSGMSNADIAEHLGVSGNTIKWHLKNVFRKLGAANRTSAVLRYSARAASFP